MNVEQNYRARGSYSLSIADKPPEGHNKVHHVSYYLQDLLSLPKHFCEVRQLPNEKTPLHYIFAPEAQKLIELFHRYGPRQSNSGSPCPIASKNEKYKFKMITGGDDNLGTLPEGESEALRKPLQDYFSKSKIDELRVIWKQITHAWLQEQLDKGSVNLFQACHELVSACLIKGILSDSACSEEEIQWNAAFWNTLFKRSEKELKTLEEMEEESKPSWLQNCIDSVSDFPSMVTQLGSLYWNFSKIHSLAENILCRTSTHNGSFCLHLKTKGYTEKQILQAVRGMLLAGQETVSHLLGFMLYEYAKHPEMQAGHKNAPDKIHNALLETLRMYSPAGVVREAGENLILKYTPESDAEIPETLYIKKGEVMNCIPYQSGHDPLLWQDPETFNCERQHLGLVRENPHFGSGPHRCIGEKAAQVEIEEIVRTLLGCARLETNEAMPELVNSFTVRPTRDIKIKFIPL